MPLHVILHSLPNWTSSMFFDQKQIMKLEVSSSHANTHLIWPDNLLLLEMISFSWKQHHTLSCSLLQLCKKIFYHCIAAMGLLQEESGWTMSGVMVLNPNWSPACFGVESRLIYCRRNNFGSHDCSHSEDVAIECNGTTTISPHA